MANNVQLLLHTAIIRRLLLKHPMPSAFAGYCGGLLPIFAAQGLWNESLNNAAIAVGDEFGNSRKADGLYGCIVDYQETNWSSESFEQIAREAGIATKDRRAAGVTEIVAKEQTLLNFVSHIQETGGVGVRVSAILPTASVHTSLCNRDRLWSVFAKVHIDRLPTPIAGSCGRWCQPDDSQEVFAEFLFDSMVSTIESAKFFGLLGDQPVTYLASNYTMGIMLSGLGLKWSPLQRISSDLSYSMLSAEKSDARYDRCTL
jgi:hypothetical protein